MADIIRYDNKDLNDPINDFDTLIGSSILTKKTKNFTIKDLMSFLKSGLTESVNNRVVNEVPLGALNGSNATFTSKDAFYPESLIVVSNGFILKQISDYRTDGNKTILLNFSPESKENLLINYTKI